MCRTRRCSAYKR